jgi:hypothetical protein
LASWQIDSFGLSTSKTRPPTIDEPSAPSYYLIGSEIQQLPEEVDSDGSSGLHRR